MCQETTMERCSSNSHLNFAFQIHTNTVFQRTLPKNRTDFNCLATANTEFPQLWWKSNQIISFFLNSSFHEASATVLFPIENIHGFISPHEESWERWYQVHVHVTASKHWWFHHNSRLELKSNHPSIFFQLFFILTPCSNCFQLFYFWHGTCLFFGQME